MNKKDKSIVINPINPIWLEELNKAGFKAESQGVSSSMIQVLHDGNQYTGRFPVPSSDDEYEVGIYINPVFGGMQIFACNCTLGCCGEEVTNGITPYSIAKVATLIEEFMKEDQFMKRGFKRH